MNGMPNDIKQQILLAVMEAHVTDSSFSEIRIVNGVRDDGRSEEAMEQASDVAKDSAVEPTGDSVTRKSDSVKRKSTDFDDDDDDDDNDDDNDDSVQSPECTSSTSNDSSERTANGEQQNDNRTAAPPIRMLAKHWKKDSRTWLWKCKSRRPHPPSSKPENVSDKPLELVDGPKRSKRYKSWLWQLEDKRNPSSKDGGAADPSKRPDKPECN